MPFLFTFTRINYEPSRLAVTTDWNAGSQNFDSVASKGGNCYCFMPILLSDNYQQNALQYWWLRLLYEKKKEILYFGTMMVRMYTNYLNLTIVGLGIIGLLF